MNRYLISLTIVYLTVSAFGASASTDFAFTEENCQKPDLMQPSFHKGLFFPNGELRGERSLALLMPAEDIVSSALRVYQRDERMAQRIFLDSQSGQFIGDQKYLFDPKTHSEELFGLPRINIASVLDHLQEMLAKGFARVISYTDAGHLHLKIPIGVKEEILATTDDENEQLLAMLKHPETLYLYHTAEKVKLLDHNDEPLSPELGWWYLNRNVIGSQLGNESIYTVVKQGDGYNTYKNPEGYTEFGPSIYIQSNKKGCFQITHKGEPINLDLSFMMPASDPEVLAASPER